MMFSGPFLVSANTVTLDSLQTEIQTLLARVKDLQAQLAALSPVSTSLISCYPFGRSLSFGVRGNDVSTLQNLLISQGFSIPAGATGYFGSQTKFALSNWQVKNNVVVTSNPGLGIFGPLSRGVFSRFCNTNGNGGTTTVPSTISFTADPQSGGAPLNVTFTAVAPITSGSSTFSVDFGDTSTSRDMTHGSCIAITAIVGGQGGIRCSSSVAHTYTATGKYTARLMQDNCPAGAQCFVGPLTVAKTIIVVTGSNATSTASTSNIVLLNAPGTVTLALHDIAEIRNENAYFEVTNLATQSVTIQFTPVGCWNSFPSDTPPEIHCMIYAVPIPPQTLTVGQSYHANNYNITLSKIENDKATFSVTTL